MKTKKTEEFFRALKFVGFSISAGVIQILSFTFLNEVVKFTYWPAYLIALVLSVLWNFTINRKFTFRTVANITKAMIQVLCYYAVFTPLSTLWGEALTNAGWNEYLVLFGTMVINLVTEYLFYMFVVYRNKVDNAINKKETIK